jgi:hypothetical protein
VVLRRPRADEALGADLGFDDPVIGISRDEKEFERALGPRGS